MNRRGRGRINNQIIDTTDNIINETLGGITFNYSENFNRIIELNSENYPMWKRKILYL